MALLFSMDITASAASSEQMLPPAGLYRIDSDNKASTQAPGHSADVRLSEDGSNGNTTTSIKADGYEAGNQLYKGKGPLTYCVKPRVIGVVPPYALTALGSCHEQSTTITEYGVIHKANCPPGATTVTIRKLDTTTWEYVTVVAPAQSPGGMDLNSLRPVLENAAKNGATAEARNKAAKQLAELPQMQDEMSKKRAVAMEGLIKAEHNAKTPEEAAAFSMAIATLKGKKTMGEVTRKERWTRIADSCADVSNHEH
ncbi:hypothetical protein AAKU64_004205 [Undibacterium sp. GrIS 1.8]